MNKLLETLLLWKGKYNPYILFQHLYSALSLETAIPNSG